MDPRLGHAAGTVGHFVQEAEARLHGGVLPGPAMPVGPDGSVGEWSPPAGGGDGLKLPARLSPDTIRLGDGMGAPMVAGPSVEELRAEAEARARRAGLKPRGAPVAPVVAEVPAHVRAGVDTQGYPMVPGPVAGSLREMTEGEREVYRRRLAQPAPPPGSVSEEAWRRSQAGSQVRAAQGGPQEAGPLSRAMDPLSRGVVPLGPAVGGNPGLWRDHVPSDWRPVVYAEMAQPVAVRQQPMGALSRAKVGEMYLTPEGGIFVPGGYLGGAHLYVGPTNVRWAGVE
jgi:hypothetical protein